MRVILSSFFLLILLLVPQTVFSIECSGPPPSGVGMENQITEYINKCQAVISNLQGQQNTLKTALSVLTSKINLAQGQINQTTAQIAQLETEISTLTQVVNSLSSSEKELQSVYFQKIREFYKSKNISPLTILLSSDNLNQALARLKYLSTAKSRDRLVLLELDKTKQNFDQQKQVKQKKQNEVETLKKQLQIQKQDLDQQQKQKKQLLVQTQNDEKKFQQLLAQAKAELEAIEAVIAGKGSETQVSSINAGDNIATIIKGASACSTGTHLHFEVAKEKINQNPAILLKETSVTWDNAPDSPFPFSGSWEWPLAGKIRLTQGYGHTSYSGRYANNIHTGIDMVNDDLSVKSSRSGTLFRGSIACGSGSLKYVHVKHKDDSYDTYYLHVNYF